MGLAGRRTWRVAACAILTAISAIAAITHGDYGITWDEEYYREYGVMLLNWYSSLGASQDALGKWGLNYYGGFFDIVAELVTRLVPHGVYETRHLLSMAFGIVGVFATYGIGYQLAGIRSGILAAIFLTLTPVYYGHMFANAKDIPFAALFALSLFCMLRSVKQLPRVPKEMILQLGLAVGLAMGVRVAGVVLLGYVALLWGGWLVASYLSGSVMGKRGVLRIVGEAAPRYLAVAAVAWVTMVAFWPWALVSPLFHPIQALRQTMSYDWPLTVLFDGRYIKASELPPSYLPTWFAISAPEFYFVALLVGLVLSLALVRRSRRGQVEVVFGLKVGLLAATIVIPVMAHVLFRATIYDGLRQFLFVLPALAALAGSAVAVFLQRRSRLLPRVAVAVLVLVSAGTTVRDMVELHPYQYVYFNRLVAGGLESASARFDTDYYGASYREGVQWLSRHYHARSGEKVRVGNPSNHFLTAYYLESNPDMRRRFDPVRAWDRPHVYMSTTRWDWHKEKKGRLLHTVRRKGVPLLYVIELNPPEGGSSVDDQDRDLLRFPADDA